MGLTAEARLSGGGQALSTLRGNQMRIVLEQTLCELCPAISLRVVRFSNYVFAVNSGL